MHDLLTDGEVLGALVTILIILVPLGLIMAYDAIKGLK